MAIIRQFFQRDLKDGEMDVFALARDVMTDNVFIINGQTRQDGVSLRYDEAKTSLAEFFQETGSPQTALMELIGTLVVEE